MRYNPLSKQDMQRILKLWNEELGTEFPMREALLKQNSFADENVYWAGSFTVEDEQGDLCGFVISKRWQESKQGIVLQPGTGWIQVLLVRSTCRGQGIGTKLLLSAEQALFKQGATHIRLGADPWHYFPGVPDQNVSLQDWVSKRGYQNTRTVHDLISGKIWIEDLPEISGVEIRLLQRGEQTKLLAFLERCFPGRWTYEALKYFELGGTGREYVVACLEGDIIGFCRINDIDTPFIAQNVYWSPLFKEPVGGVGPLGIDSRFRRSGYGLAMVHTAVELLKKRGAAQVIIDWTDQLHFYGKLGFEVWKTYHQFAKKLAPH